MGNVNSILRRSTQVDTSNSLPPVLTSLRLESGVYVGPNSGSGDDDASSLVNGRVSLGIIAVAILGAMGFYYYTRSIQGGG